MLLRLSGLLTLAALAVSCADSSAAPTDNSSGGSSSGSASSSGSTSSSSGSPVVEDSGPPPKPAPTGIRFVAMGDTGTGTSDQQKVGNTISAFCEQRGCDFIQLLGDNLYPSGADSVNDEIWKSAFETPYAAVTQDFWVVLGNHDYGANGAGTDFGKAQNEIDYSSKSTKWKLPSAYWHKPLDKSDAKLEIFGLDTNKILFDLAADQKNDIPAWIAASTAEWKIAVGHHPYKSNGQHGNAGNYDGIPLTLVSGKNVKSFLEEKVCGKVDVYLSGHDHSRQWLNESCSGTELAVSGGGAKTTELGGNNASLFESLELGFLYIIIEGKKLTAEFIDENGKTEFTHTITKP